MANREVRYLLPRAENFLRLVNANILENLRNGQPAKLNLPPTVELAHKIVNETGVILYRDYDQATIFLDERTR